MRCRSASASGFSIAEIDGLIDGLAPEEPGDPAAEKTGRRAFVCELDPLYCDRILRRWAIFAKDDVELVLCGWPRSGRMCATASASRRIVDIQLLRVFVLSGSAPRPSLA